LARALFAQERHAEALAEVLRAERTVADAHLEVLRARILDQMGASSAALAAYRHALWLNPRLQSVPADIRRLTSGAGATAP
jgi:Flp pilus assembly protein TadD